MKKLPAMQETQETQVQSVVWEDPLEKEMATQSNILASGKLHGQRSLTGYSLWGCKELNTTKYARTAVPPVVCFFVHLEKPQFSSVQSLSHV